MKIIIWLGVNVLNVKEWYMKMHHIEHISSVLIVEVR